MEAELAAVKEQNDRLEEKNTALEHAMQLREEQKKFDAQPAEFDGQYYVRLLLCGIPSIKPCRAGAR